MLGADACLGQYVIQPLVVIHAARVVFFCIA